MSYNKETGMYEGYIYLITNKINGKQYVGQTVKTVQKRWNRHLADSKNFNFYFYKAIRKYGKENFIVDTLEVISNKSKENLFKILDNKEIEYISSYNTLLPNGYNSTRGGSSISISFEKAVCQYTLQGEFVAEYESATIAEQKTNACRSVITDCCNKKSYSSGGYIWCFKGDDISDIVEHFSEEKISIDLYDERNNFIQSFEDIYSLYEEIKYDIPPSYTKSYYSFRSSVLKCCDNKIRKIGKYKITYKNSKPQNDKKNKRVYQYDNGKLVQEYLSLSEVERITGIKSKEISDACKGLSNGAGGYMWKFADNTPTSQIKQTKMVRCVELDKIYDSMTDASIDLSIPLSSISCCINGRMKMAGGYTWEVLV